jgi:AraC-like DNA-binding protein
VFLATCGFEPHRHDTYAIGVTVSGVQTFRYRGGRRVAFPGQVHVLHPDETHDGAPGTDDGFGYRILYVSPELVREALGGSELPFVEDPVRDPAPATAPLAAILSDLDAPISDLGRVEIATQVADMLVSLERPHTRRRLSIDVRAVELVREHLAAHPSEQTPASELERITGSDRFTIVRHFRRAFGTSPDRYRTLRRLDRARAAIAAGRPLAQAAFEAGFSDQSHMTRQFKRSYGMTPARWARLLAGAKPPATASARGLRAG